MNKIILCLLLVSFETNGQVLFLDDLIAKVYYDNPNLTRKDTIAFVTDREPNIIPAKRGKPHSSFDLFFFDRDSLFVDFLRKRRDCNLIRLRVIKKYKDSLQVRLILGSTTFDAYCNPEGGVIGEIDDRTISLKWNKKYYVWEY